MNWEEVCKIFEKTKTLYDIHDIQQDIQDINEILSTPFFNSADAQLKIKSINEKHKEIVFVHNFLYSLKNPFPLKMSESVDSASDPDLISDLMWKRDYLNAKGKATCLNELIKYLRKKYNL